MSEFAKYGKTKRLQGKNDPFWILDEYVVTSKIDGTNSRICWDGSSLSYGSRNRIITPSDDNFGFAKWYEENIDEGLFDEHFSDVSPVVVFGEFFSKDIQKRIEYPEEPQFVVFDVYIYSKFLDWEDVVDVSDKLGFEVVQHQLCSQDKVQDIVGKLKNGETMYDPYALKDADDERRIIEGVVARPSKELVEPYGSNYGTRLIRKIKSKKFEEVSKKSNSNNSGSNSDFNQEEVDKVLKYVTENRIFSVLEDIKEDKPDITFYRSMAGDIIKDVFNDMHSESEEELDEKIMRKVAGNKIANKYFDMLEEGYVP